MISGPRTFSSSHRDRQRTAHAKSDGYGRHRHLYLHDRILSLARSLAGSGGGAPSWLDYGCGKGGFIEEIRPKGLFATVTGYDPAVAAFQTRPVGSFDLVTCLDVLDVVEARFLDAVLTDVASLTRGIALIDCMTRPKRENSLPPHPPYFWTALVRRHMDVVETHVEFPDMEGFERVVIVCAPRPAADKPATPHCAK